MGADIIFVQVFVLFLLIGVGVIAQKTKIINDTAAKSMTELLLMVINPGMILISFMVEKNPDRTQGLLIATVAAVVSQGVAIGLAHLIYRKQPHKEKVVLRAAMVFTNCGFMGLPLLNVFLGAEGVFYGAAYVAVFNVLMWTYGVVLYSGKAQKGMAIKSLFNPGVVVVILGFVLFIWSINLPKPIFESLRYIGDMNTPLSMMIIGNRIAQVDLRSLYRNARVWMGAILRIVVLPALVVLALRLLGVQGLLLLACVIPAACPVAANVVLFAEKFDADASLASRLVTLSTLLSIISIPLMILLANI